MERVVATTNWKIGRRLFYFSQIFYSEPIILCCYSMLHKSLPMCFLFLGAALCTPEHIQNENHDPGEGPALSHEEHATMDKRSPHYNFGLGKRAYSYVSEYKRLPVYNFGLGKR